MAKRKNQITLEDLGLDFDAYGITISNIDTTKWIFRVNKAFNIQFKRVEDLVMDENGQSYAYLCYEWERTNTEELYTLIQNHSFPKADFEAKNTMGMLFPMKKPFLFERPNYDFILRISPTQSQNIFDDVYLTNDLEIQTIDNLPLESLSEKTKLLF